MPPYIILSILFAAMLVTAFLSGYYFGRRDGIRKEFEECKKAIKRGDRLISYCCKQAYKYSVRKDMLSAQEGFGFIYAIGINAHERDKWLKRVERLQKWINK